MESNVPRSEKVRAVTLGVLLGVLPSIGIAWAFAVTAAEHVMDPHLESAKYRVHIMCSWARIQDQNTRAICEQVGAKCQTLDATAMLAGCNEQQQD